MRNMDSPKRCLGPGCTGSVGAAHVGGTWKEDAEMGVSPVVQTYGVLGGFAQLYPYCAPGGTPHASWPYGPTSSVDATRKIPRRAHKCVRLVQVARSAVVSSGEKRFPRIGAAGTLGRVSELRQKQGGGCPFRAFLTGGSVLGRG